MARIRQYYGGTGVPLVVLGDPIDAVLGWRSQRARMRGWLELLDTDGWSGPTRCESWDVRGLVRHLASACQFLGYTVHEASQGTATSLLQGMDTRGTVEAAAATLGDLTPGESLELLAAMDAVADTELEGLGTDGLLLTAEAPPGNLPVHLAVSHFLFDSWVHEYDLLLPGGDQPEVDQRESLVVVAYLAGLASVSTGAAVPLDLRLSSPDLRIGVSFDGGITTVTPGSVPDGALVVEGTVVDIVDRMTGRPGGPVTGDSQALGVLDSFALVLST
jgi:uncharacterized protein (TIGR03083 family)